jgi:hypothetical protein
VNPGRTIFWGFAFLVLCFILQAMPSPSAAEQGVATTRTIVFSGEVWKVKSSKTRVGPGPNFFSDGTDNVWVDDAGRLHLKITRQGDKWSCAEVISAKSYGLGTYRFDLDTPLQDIDTHITLGLFTWSDAREHAHREIDVECGKWGKASDVNNAQFVVQPYQLRGRLVRFHVPGDLHPVEYDFQWRSDSVRFESFSPSPSTLPDRQPFKQWNFTGNSVPPPGIENARINLWLSTALHPADPGKTEAIIRRFGFTALDGAPQTRNDSEVQTRP